jgi:hypothetical protein
MSDSSQEKINIMINTLVHSSTRYQATPEEVMAAISQLQLNLMIDSNLSRLVIENDQASMTLVLKKKNSPEAVH